MRCPLAFPTLHSAAPASSKPSLPHSVPMHGTDALGPRHQGMRKAAGSQKPAQPRARPSCPPDFRSPRCPPRPRRRQRSHVWCPVGPQAQPDGGSAGPVPGPGVRARGVPVGRPGQPGRAAPLREPPRARHSSSCASVCKLKHTAHQAWSSSARARGSGGSCASRRTAAARDAHALGSLARPAAPVYFFASFLFLSLPLYSFFLCVFPLSFFSHLRHVHTSRNHSHSHRIPTVTVPCTPLPPILRPADPILHPERRGRQRRSRSLPRRRLRRVRPAAPPQPHRRTRRRHRHPHRVRPRHVVL
jgi:hypothetical protein